MELKGVLVPLYTGIKILMTLILLAQSNSNNGTL